MLVCLCFLLCLSASVSRAGERSSYRFIDPTRVATATCTDFAWVNDMASVRETSRLIERLALDTFDVPRKDILTWRDGSAEDFFGWLQSLSDRDRDDVTLILYLATHQNNDGSLKFSKGPDLTAESLIEAVNKVARKYRRVLLISDCCYGSAVEKHGDFRENVYRLYSSSDDELSFSYQFSKGPYGLDDYSAGVRKVLKSKLDWEPSGLTLLSIIGLKAGLELSASPAQRIGLQKYFRKFLVERDDFDRKVRQNQLPRFLLVPSTANFDIVERR